MLVIVFNRIAWFLFWEFSWYQKTNWKICSFYKYGARFSMTMSSVRSLVCNDDAFRVCVSSLYVCAAISILFSVFRSCVYTKHSNIDAFRSHTDSDKTRKRMELFKAKCWLDVTLFFPFLSTLSIYLSSFFIDVFRCCQKPSPNTHTHTHTQMSNLETMTAPRVERERDRVKME